MKLRFDSSIETWEKIITSEVSYFFYYPRIRIPIYKNINGIIHSNKEPDIVYSRPLNNNLKDIYNKIQTYV